MRLGYPQAMSPCRRSQGCIRSSLSLSPFPLRATEAHPGARRALQSARHWQVSFKPGSQAKNCQEQEWLGGKPQGDGG